MAIVGHNPIQPPISINNAISMIGTAIKTESKTEVDSTGEPLVKNYWCNKSYAVFNAELNDVPWFGIISVSISLRKSNAAS